MTVSFDSTTAEELDDVLVDWVSALSDHGHRSVFVCGPSPIEDDGRRELLACKASTSFEHLHAATQAFVGSSAYVGWNGPLVAWHSLDRSTPTAQNERWRDLLREDGLRGLVRVAFELPGAKAFEIFTATTHELRNRADAMPIAWASMASWPDARRLISARRCTDLKLNANEVRCLKLIMEGHSAKTIAEAMATSERTANYFVGSLSDKLRTKGRNALPIRGAWLGLLD